MKKFYLFLLMASLSFVGYSQTSSYSYLGGVQTYSVAAGVTSLGIDMYGAAGGIYTGLTVLPGYGGRVQCNLAVTPGQLLYIYVGQVGSNGPGTGPIPPGGLNSGGGADGGSGSTSDGGAAGGASTDIRTVVGSTMAALSSRLVVAGGGAGTSFNSGEVGGQGGGLIGGGGFSAGTSAWSPPNGGTQTSGGIAEGSGLPGGFGYGGAAYPSFWGSGGGGGWFGGGGCYDGSGGGGSSYTSPTLATAVTHTQGYSAATGNGHVTITVLCALTGTITGANYVCTGSTIALTDLAGGGTWSSSATFATVNSSTGVVTGVSPGVVTITYNVSNPCGGVGALATKVITVSQAAVITSGTPILCTGQSTTITASPGGGTWSSTNTLAASVVSTGGTTGAATGLATGTAGIIYTLSSGCAATDFVTVNVSPPYNTVTVTGTGGYCAGSPTVFIGLNGSSTGINYNLWSGGTLVTSSPVAGTGSPITFAGPITAPGTYTVVATAPSGCNLTMTGSATVFLNPNPTLTGSAPSSVCVGSSLGLSATPTGGTWTSNNIAVASVGPSSGSVAGITPGTAIITYTLAGGCNVSKVITVNATPVAITGTANVCTGSSTLLTETATGGTWSSSSLSLATVGIASGLVSGVSAGTVNISYSYPSGCYATIPVVVNLLPTGYSITGGGPYCQGAGVHVGLSYANAGISYQLYRGVTVASSAIFGAGSSLDFGLQYTAGTYTVFATNPVTGCSGNMPGSTTISINSLPTTSYSVGGGGSYCNGGTGVAVTLSNSDFGTTYQLLNGGPVGAAVSGAGGLISFGMQTGSGSYTVFATTSAGCTGTMTGSATVSINPLPNAYVVSGGGPYCANAAGSDIMLEGSDISTNYQLYNGSMSVGSSMSGTGSPLDFGLQTAGNYTIVATTGTTPACSSNMTGSAVIIPNPLPTPYVVNGGGAYCVGGAHVGLNFSDPGISYQLYVGGTGIGLAVMGSSSSIDFGLQTAPGVYTVVATNTTTGCVSNMTGSAVVSENTPPVAYSMTGGGQYCTGGTGSPVGLSSSSGGVSYQLYNGATPSGSAMTGTGGALAFGLRAAPGTYTIVATNTASGCTNTMLGTDLITEAALPNAYSVMTGTSSSSYCVGGAGVDIQLLGSDNTATYQLYKGTLPIGTSMAGTGAPLDFGYKMLPGVYTIVATSTTLPVCKNNMSGNVPITINPLPNIYTTTGGGNYCVGAPGARVGLSGSNTGVNYQLTNGGVPVGGVVLAGTGVALDFGYQSTGGAYSVVATNATTFCTNNMAGTAPVVANSLPDTFSLTGDGTSYCASASGSPVGMVGSVAGIRYQLYNGTSATGAAVAGTGAPISFGNHTSGTYTVVAINSATGCTNNMPRSATISVNPLPAPFAVNGTGNICSGGAGTPIGLDNSVAGINYQLYYAGLPTPTIVNGTGSAISFGLQTGAGTYTAEGIDTTTSCTSNMTGSAVITVVPSPAVNTVSGGGTYCAGGAGEDVRLLGTTNGISYQLMIGSTTVGAPVTGLGAALDFGLQTAPGTYTIVASPGGTCQTNMTGSALVVVNPLPTVENIIGGGTYCAGGTGQTIYLNASVSETTYQLYNGSTASGSAVVGTGADSLNFLSQTTPGSYTIKATNSTTGCSTTMAGSVLIIVAPLPHVYNMMGGGNYCTGGNGVHIELSSSNTDVDYQLYNGTATVDTAVAGSGTELDFGLLTAAGNYTVVATDQYTHCTNNMEGSATIAINTLLMPTISTTRNPTGTINPGQIVTFTANVTSAGTSPTFQWYIDGVPVGGATDATFTTNKLANHDSVRCEVTSTGMCGGFSANSSTTIAVSTVGVQQITSSGSNISLLPNPNKGAFTIKGTLGTTDDEAVMVEITDMVGHVVYTENVMSHSGSINAQIIVNSTLANGMYLVSLRSASANQVFHMVIEE